jgi:hypothetical protein
MIQATARVLKNVIEIRVGAEQWLGRPIGWNEEGLGSRIAALFSTEYVTFRPHAPQEVHSTVSYRVKPDEIRISMGGEQWHTKSTTFGPITFDYGGARYTVNERLTGRFAIVKGNDPVAVGTLIFRTCTMDEYPPELEVFLANFALGFLIRSLTWADLR